VKKLVVTVVSMLFLLPSIGMVSVGALFSTAALACAPSTSLSVGAIPDSLTATTRSGDRMTLGRAQLTHAATIITVGAQTEGVGRDGVVIALMAALTESRLRMLANSTAYPASTRYPHDGDGRDHDSLGLFQMRPASGWGSVEQLMTPDYQARAFFGGRSGPNYPSPRGLLDIPGWRSLAPGAAAQAVEVSAYPDRYAVFQPVAEAILAALIGNIGAVGALDFQAGCLPGLPGDCPASGSAAERGLQPPAQRLLRCVVAAFPEITSIGGKRSSSSPTCRFSDHCRGLAVDFMVPRWNSAQGNALGWRIARWVEAHADELNVSYVIWDSRKWNPRASDRWRPYTHPYGNSNPTLAHRDHVHVSVGN
jgi:hypothetical protein